jgi:hypothetical protein
LTEIRTKRGLHASARENMVVVLEFLGLGDARTHECPTGKRAQMVMIVRKCEVYVQGLLF